MVYFQPSSATRTITVQVAEVNTILTIGAPSSVVQGVVFSIGGSLTRADTGVGLIQQSVKIYYNGTLLVTALTDGFGLYVANVSINMAGTFTLTAEFEGVTIAGLTLGASSASTRIGTLIEPSILPLVVLAGIVAYVVLKK